MPSSPDRPLPPASRQDPRRTHLLSNGRLTVMLGVAGAGFCQWQDLAVTRWREDPTGQRWGSYLLLRDEDTGATWSPCAQPYGDHGADDAVDFSPGLARFRRRRHLIDSVLEVAVAADSDTELRRLELTNASARSVTLSVTSYAELVLGPAAADRAHPAFSKMFVQTEWDAQHALLLGTRRHRAEGDVDVWAAHALQFPGEACAADACESDRARFLGRTRGLRDAQAMQPGGTLSGTVGCVLDPVFSLRRTLTLAPGESASVLAWTRLAASRAQAQALAAQVASGDAAQALFAAAADHARQQRRQLGIDDAQAARFAHWLAALLGNDPGQRAASATLECGHGGAPVLWAAGISGDRPILLLPLGDAADLDIARDALLAQALWRGQRVAVDVVLLNEAAGAQGDALQRALDPLLQERQAALKQDTSLPRAELFGLRADAIGEDLRHGLHTAARVVLGQTPAPQPSAAETGAVAAPAPLRAETPATGAAATTDTLEFDNGLGGFGDEGRAYEIDLDEARPTPAPWVNVIANAAFGFLVSAEGGGYAWSQNSQQNPLTPWPNDPVSDSPHDVLYLRDEDDGEVWSATALPIRVPGASYVATHGKGWSRFDSDVHGIASSLTQCVPTGDTVKLSRLQLCNRSGRTRHIALTAYVEWALGANGSTPQPYVVTARDDATGALFARNPWRPDFAARVAFADFGGLQQSLSGDRHAFLGELGCVGNPLALRDGAPLDGWTGAGRDPCAALQLRVALPPHTQLELRFLLGDADDAAAAQALVRRYRDVDLDGVLAEVAAQWIGVLDAVQVRTPDRAMDVLLNDCLLYQVLACRLWARTGYYQASGAYGFRDQLQDVMALCVSRPDLAREHLLRAAGRQFAEGDVQHWWLPPGGQGIRTKISDDRLWLGYVAAHYVDTTGDRAVLDEELPFLAGQAIPEHASDAFFQPSISDRKASVYEHCALAIDASLTRGAHGLPLIGTGDWNDGMNAVGEKGRGESSWLGWFLLATIDAFAPRAEQRGEAGRAAHWRAFAGELRQALEQAWDGQWYRRGYYDDGAPLGSKLDDECRIDTIAQSWSVLAGAADQQHAAEAMASTDRLLVDHVNGIARLFTPPFDHSAQNPGYIKGYPPGVRENGGQYTHGATWSIFAWAKLGDGDRATALFDLLNPIRHSADAAAAQRYKVEPYVVSADVYSVAPHVGRGGWTWYTGSAAWLYRAGLEAVLGFQLQGDRLRIDPCIARSWPGFGMTFQYRVGARVTRYEIGVENPQGVCRGVALLEMDGQPMATGEAARLVDDGGVHVLRVVLG